VGVTFVDGASRRRQPSGGRVRAGDDGTRGCEVASAVQLARPMSPHCLDILVVDNKNPLTVLATRLLRERHAVRRAGTGIEAIQQVVARPPDVVVCDATLDVDGVHLLETIARHYPATRRILFTGGDPSGYDFLRRAGTFERVLPKPLHPGDLQAAIEGEDGSRSL
jgi:CheY-like chemotaxis protein